jgi:type IV pilus assembly protein PilA
MMVVAIIGILAATALPTFQDYMVRARVSEGLDLASHAELAVSDTYQSEGAFVAANSGFQFNAATKNVLSITIDDGTGVVRIVFNAALGPMAGQTLFLTPSVNGLALTASPSGFMVWKCSVGGNTKLYRYVPSDCRS